MTKTPLRYSDTAIIPELDGLRGIAIGMVLIFHYWTMSIPHPFGTFSKIILGSTALFWSGVDLFFVLSGFLIGGILISHQSSQNYFRTFYMRRFTRIFPIYYMMFFIYLILSHTTIYNLIPSLLQSPIPVWPFAFFIQNFFLNPDLLQPTWLVPTWSLAVEEQFYLFIPTLLWVVAKKRIPIILMALIILLVTIQYSSSKIPEFCSPDRYIGLLLGVLTAYIWKTPKLKDFVDKKSSYLYWILMVCFIGGIAIMAKSKEATALIFIWIAIVYMFLLMIVLFRQKSLLNRICRWSWLKRLGVISYGTYLYHIPIFYLVQYYIFKQAKPEIYNYTTLFFPLVSLAVTIIVANLSYNHIEMRFLQFGKRFSY